MSQNWIWIVLLIGLLLRVLPYMQSRSLEHDEAHLANNLIHKNYIELTGVLDNNQAAPIGYLWLTKAVTAIGGNGEKALRFWSMIAGIFSLWFFYRLAAHFFKDWFLLLAVTLFAFCDPALFFANTFKQYSFDLLISLILLQQALVAMRSSNLPKLNLGILGTIAIWFSQPSVFILAAIGIVLLLVRRKDVKQRYSIAGWIFFWIVSFAFYYLFFLKDSIGGSHLQNYHSPYFMPLRFWEWESVQWYWTHYFELFRSPGGILFKYMAGTIALVGIGAAFMKKQWEIGLVILPLLIAFLASSLHQYSVIPRLLLFCIPGLLILVVYGLRSLYNLLLPKGKNPLSIIVITALGISIALQPVLDGIHHTARFRGVEECRPVLAFIADKIEPSQTIYVYPYGLAQFEYYRFRMPILAQQSMAIGLSPYKEWKKDLDKMEGEFWLFFAHDKREDGSFDSDRYLDYLSEKGVLSYSIREKGSSAFLINFDSK